MKKKVMGTIGALGLTALLLGACGGGGKTDGSGNAGSGNAGGGDTGGKQVVTYALWDKEYVKAVQLK